MHRLINCAKEIAQQGIGVHFYLASISMLYRRVRLRAAVLPEDSDGRLVRASLSSLTPAALWEPDFSLKSEEVKNVPSRVTLNPLFAQSLIDTN